MHKSMQAIFVLSGDQQTDLVMTGMYEQHDWHMVESMILFPDGDSSQTVVQHTKLAGTKGTHRNVI